MKPATRTVLLTFCALLFVTGTAGTAVAGEAGEPLRGRGVAAEVGGSPVLMDTVLETWGPYWYDVRDRVRAGQLDPAEADRLLRGEWEKALDAAIRDELFYREALRELNTLINDYIEKSFNAQRRSQQAVSRPMLEREIRREMEASIERDTTRMEERLLRASGGPIALQRSLAARGITYQVWRERLQRRAFTGFYFSRRAALRLSEPGPGRIQSYYRQHPEKFRRPDTVVFLHIFFSADKHDPEAAYAAAARVWEELSTPPADPNRFAETARHRSDDPVSAPRGGRDTCGTEMDTVAMAGRDWLLDVAKAAADERPGAVGPVLESPYGYHLAMLLEKRPGGLIPFAEVHEQIAGELAGEAMEQAMGRLYESLRREVPIRIHAVSFPLMYSMTGVRAAGGGMAPPSRRIGGDAAFPENRIR